MNLKWDEVLRLEEEERGGRRREGRRGRGGRGGVAKEGGEGGRVEGRCDQGSEKL